MAEDLIDEFINRGAVTESKEFMLSALNELYEKLQKVASIKIDLQGANSLYQLQPAIKEASQATAELENITKRVTQRIAEQNGSSKELTQQILLEAKASKELSSAKLNEAKSSTEAVKQKILEERASVAHTKAKQGEIGAYKLLSTEAKIATENARNISTQYGVFSQQAKGAAANALGLNTKLLEIDKTIGISTKNVGNYGSALGKSWSIIRQAAYILPGIGIAGLFNVAFEGIKKAAEVLGFFTTKLTDTEKVQTEMYKSNLKAAESYGKERGELELLMAQISNENRSKKEKLEILKELKEKYPGYFDDIKTEKDLIDKLPDAYLRAAQGILLKAKAEAAQGLIGENFKKQEQLKQQALKKEAEIYKDVTAAQDRMNKSGYRVDDFSHNVFLTAKQKELESVKKTVKEETSVLEEENKNLIALIISSDAEIQKLGGRVTKHKDDEDGKKALEALKKKISEEQKLLEKSAEAEIKVDEIKYEKGKIDEFQYESEKFRITKEFIQKAIALEKQLGKHASAATIEEYIVKEKQAEVEFTKFIQKQIEERSKFAYKSTLEALKFEKEAQTKERTLADETTKKIDDAISLHLKNMEASLQHEYDLESIRHGKNIGSEIEFLKKRLLLYRDDYTKRKELLDKIDILEEQQRKRKKDFEKQLADELISTGAAFVDAGYEKEKNRIQDQINLIDVKKQKEIDAINQTTASAQEKANRIAIIEAVAAAQHDQLVRKQKQAEVEKAKFDKAKAIADIIESTTIAVVEALGAKPWTPANIGLAALVGAIGAVQLARVIATPIPHYKDGIDSHPGGLAVVGDGGKSEMIVTPDGALHQTPAIPTVVDLQKGARVLPDFEKAIAYAHATSFTLNQNKKEFDQLEDTVKKGFANLSKVIQNKREIQFTKPSSWDELVKDGSTTRKWLNRSL